MVCRLMLPAGVCAVGALAQAWDAPGLKHHKAMAVIFNFLLF